MSSFSRSMSNLASRILSKVSGKKLTITIVVIKESVYNIYESIAPYPVRREDRKSHLRGLKRFDHKKDWRGLKTPQLMPTKLIGKICTQIPSVKIYNSFERFILEIFSRELPVDTKTSYICFSLTQFLYVHNK